MPNPCLGVGIRRDEDVTGEREKYGKVVIRQRIWTTAPAFVGDNQSLITYNQPYRDDSSPF